MDANFMKLKKELQNEAEYVLFIAALAILKLFPAKVRKTIVLFLFDAIGFRIGIRRKVAESQIAEVFPSMSKAEIKQLVRQVYRNLGLNVYNIYLTKAEDLYRRSRFEHKENLEEALARKKGVLLAAGHFGDWEASCRVLPMAGIGMAVIVKRQRNHKFDDYTNAIRCSTGCSIINMNQALRGILEHTKHNDAIGILIDQDAGRHGILTDFLGKPASVWKGTAKIALKYKIPIVPAFAFRDKNENICFQFGKMIDPAPLADTEENILLLLKEMNEILEEKIRRYPEQWLWLHKRWKGAKYFKPAAN